MPVCAALAVILLIGATLRLWQLQANGWGAEYYSAAVFSMSSNWRNFFFDAFDPAGFISVDKPPVALWLQVLSVKLFGFRPFSVLVPQVLQGIAAIALLYHLVKRGFGTSAGLLAALFFALTPVWIAVNRTNNTDTCLVLVLMLAGWALLKASETGRRRTLLGSMLLVGLAFNVKMLAGFVLLPVFFVTYFLAAPLPWRRRLIDLTLAGMVAVASALPWVLAVEATPAPDRPYVGGSRNNSMLELVVGHNALSRFTATWKRQAVIAPSAHSVDAVATNSGDASTANSVDPSTANSVDPSTVVSVAPSTANSVDASTSGVSTAEPSLSSGGTAATGLRHTLRILASRVLVHSRPGPLRLASGQLAAQVAWLVPFALIAMLAGARRAVPARRGSAADPAPPAERLALMFWSGWLLIYVLIYSSLGGIIHFYYLANLAPAVCALAGIGLVIAWRQYRQPGAVTWLLPASLLATAGWQYHVHSSGLVLSGYNMLIPRWPWPSWMVIGMLTMLGGAAVVLSLDILMRRTAEGRLGREAPGLRPPGIRLPRVAGVMAVFAVIGALILPVAWGLSSVLTPAPGIAPSADLYRLIAATSEEQVRLRAWWTRPSANTRLTEFVLARHRGERFLLTTTTSELAASLIISTGQAVMARGGFHGLDPVLQPDDLARLVARRQVRFALLGDVSPVFRRMGADEAIEPLNRWIRANGQAVDPALWRGALRGPSLELYDLAPEPRVEESAK